MSGGGGPYQARPTGIFYVRETQHGLEEKPLTNFTAAIVGSVVEDDGAEQSRLFELACVHRSKTTAFRIPAASFALMNWPVERLGPGAIVEPGLGTKDRARAAIQHLSDRDLPTITVYTHTGWRNITDVGWVYLHAGGAIGANGPVPSVETRLEGPLALFRLLDPPTGEVLVTAAQASLRLLELAPRRISAPAFAAIWRAILGGTDLGLFSVGKTGEFKTEHAVLHQQHFGAEMDRLHLPGSFSGTDNALEDLLFRAKDTLFVLDDFKPSGSVTDDARLHAKADRLFRGAGNGAARARMRADTSLRPPRPPRALPFGTGEELPRGHSLRARLVSMEFKPGDIEKEALTRCQADGRKGLYAQTASAFIRWCAGQYEALRERVRERTEDLRAEMGGEHKRTPANVAALLAGLEVFCEFAAEATGEEALTRAEAATLLTECKQALQAAAHSQADSQEESDPARRYVKLLVAAVSSGQAHLAATDGNVPRSPEAWGWREEPAGRGKEWRAKGDRIGWVEDQFVYLQPTAAYRAACAMAGPGDGLPVTEPRLRRLMNAQGMLRMTDAGRARLVTRIVLQGARMEVLCIPSALLQEPAQPAQPGEEAPF